MPSSLVSITDLASSLPKNDTLCKLPRRTPSSGGKNGDKLEILQRTPCDTRSSSLTREAPDRSNSLTLLLQQGRRRIEDMQQNKSQGVTFEVDYGYGVDLQEPQPVKKRKFQRRNSKTPAMLLAMSSAVASLPPLEVLGDGPEEKKSNRPKPFTYVDQEGEDDDIFDSSLEIAEALVNTLTRQKSRRPPMRL